MEIPVKIDGWSREPISSNLLPLAEKRLNEGDYFGYIFTFNRCGRLGALLNLVYSVDLSKDQLRELMCHVWLDSETTLIDRVEWKQLFSFLGQIMTDTSAHLPIAEKIKIYRGYQAPVAKPSIMGLSWTLDKDKALWFANRFELLGGCNRYIAETTVFLFEVKGYLVGREEEEVLVLPTHARKNMKVSKIN